VLANPTPVSELPQCVVVMVFDEEVLEPILAIAASLVVSNIRSDATSSTAVQRITGLKPCNEITSEITRLNVALVGYEP